MITRFKVLSLLQRQWKRQDYRVFLQIIERGFGIYIASFLSSSFGSLTSDEFELFSEVDDSPFSSFCFFDRFHFMRRFWNQIFTCKAHLDEENKCVILPEFQ